MTFLAQLVVLGSTLLAPVPKQRGIDPGTIAECEKLGAVYGTMRTLSNGRIEFVAAADHPAAVGLPAFHIRRPLLKDKLPEIPEPFGLMVTGDAGYLGYCSGARNLTSVVMNCHAFARAGFEELADLPNLKHLRIVRANALKDDALMWISGFKKLESLDLHTNTNFTRKARRELIDLKKLEVLLLPYVNFTLADLSWIADPEKIRSLALSCGGDRDFKVLENFTRLQSLEFHCRHPESSSQLTQTAFASLGELRKLRRFVADHARIAADCTETIAGFAELEELSLKDCPVSPAGLQKLAGMAYLTSLDLTGVHLLDGSLEPFTRITRLTIPGTPMNDRAGTVLSRFERLEYLDVSSNNNLPLSAYESIAKLPKLKSLNLDSTSVRDDTLKNLNCYPTLEELNVRNTFATDEGIIALKGCKKLTYLHVENTKLTDACMPTLIRLPLRHVEMARTGVTGKHLDEWLRSPTLIRVNLNATGVTPAEVKALEVAHPKRLFR